MPDPPSLETCIVRFPSLDGGTAGLGALVHRRHVITCAHVVNAALGLGKDAQDRPDSPVTVEFPLLPGRYGSPPRLRGGVVAWLPPSTGTAGGDDIAGLVLADDPPAEAAPARLSVESAQRDRPVIVYGYPGNQPRPGGGFVAGVIRGIVGNGRVQIDSDPDSALRVQPGFSGSPVYDEAAGRVVGIIAEAPRAAPERDSYAISAGQIRRAWPEILSTPSQLGSASRRNREPSAKLAILHVSGVRFTGEPDCGQHYFGPLHRDLAGLAQRHGIHPDLLIVTGDLADRGRPSEFRQATRFLNSLADAADIPHRHVAIVPGNHDVNRQACAAYFAAMEANEDKPVAPFLPKWEQYTAAVREFYDGTPAADAFTPDEPFTLFEMPDLNVVVAGLNSTIADSHRDSDHHGHLGRDQIEWFRGRLADYRRRGWLRIAAVHHGEPDDSAAMYEALGSSKLAHLFLRDASPEDLPRGLPGGVLVLATRSARYQLVTVRPASVTRYARRYATGTGRWERDASIRPGGPDVRPGRADDHVRISHRLTDAHEVFPSAKPPGEQPDPFGGEPVAGQRNEFLDRVADAARVQFPADAVITEYPRENYLRVSVNHGGGGIEQWPVGVIDGPPSKETIGAFADGIHARFASADRSLRSELVYNALDAPPGLAGYARQRGIRLKSMAEYQGLLNLAPLTAAQRERLASDSLHPARLYVEQRYRIVHPGRGDAIRTGLISQAVDWLGTEHARLVMVLGDSGRGKTAFLRQLTRELPIRLPGVTPVLIELRGLEKGPTPDHLLAQHLVQQGIEGFSKAKLRYMTDSGRIALLFDGFDELELRVGYKNAASYLQRLVSSVSPEGQAKVVLTSRTQHFRSEEQVLTALGQQVESRASSRVVLLEDFSDGQMAEFLARFYDGDERRARERLGLVRRIGNLLNLAHNPRMLSFIAELEPGQLLATPDGSGQVNAGRLYERIISSWLEIEADRRHHEHGRPDITKDERLQACLALALRLWQSPDPQLAMDDLSDEVTAALSDLTDRGFTGEEAAHAIAAGSLLVRTEDGAFSFIHQSVMEWLVAKAAARDLTVLAKMEITRLTAEFVIDLAGSDAVLPWAADVLADPSAPAAMRKNAYVLVRELGEEAGHEIGGASRPGRGDGVRLGALDLRGRDLSGQDLTGADLRGANLAGMRLDEANLAGADLSGADLTGVTMIRGSLAGAVLAGSTWDRAAVLSTVGLPAADRNPELSAAAIGGLDPAEAMFLPPGERFGAAFSPDGTLLAIARGHAAQLIDTASDTTVRIIRGHTMQVTDVAFSPDGTLLATASRDGTARLWNLPAGTARCTLAGHEGWVTAVTFSPGGRGTVATASRDRTARIWDSASGTARATFAGHGGSVDALSFSPDGSALATASGDATVRTWTVADGAPHRTLTGHGDVVTAVAFSPDGTLLATGSKDRTVRVWDAVAGTARSTIAEYPEAVTAVAFSPDGTLLATAHGTRAETLDSASGTRQATFRERSPLTGVAFSSDGTLLAAASTDRAHIWDLESGAQRIAHARSAAPVTSLAFSPDGELLAVADTAGAAHSWSTRTGERRAIFRAPRSQAVTRSQPVTAVTFSPDSSLLATASPDGTIRIWDTAAGTQKRMLHLRDYPAAVAFSPDSERLAAGSLDGSFRSWYIDGAGRIPQSPDAATAMAFSSDGAFLVTATASGNCVVYRVSAWTAVVVATHSGVSGRVSAVAVSRDGTLLAVAMPDGTARIWDATAGRRIATLTGHATAPNGIAFSRDAAMVITGSDDGTARIWDTRTGHERAVVAGHCDRIRAVAFSADGTLAATGAPDGTARIWDAGSGNPVAAFIALPGGGYATLLPDGAYKLDGDADDIWWAVKLRRFGPGELDPHVPGLRRLDPGTEISWPTAGRS